MWNIRNSIHLWFYTLILPSDSSAPLNFYQSHYYLFIYSKIFIETASDHKQPPPQATHSRGEFGGLPSPSEVLLCWGWGVPAQRVTHSGQRLVVSGHSQSSQLTGLGKSLPLTCQQQPRLNYNRRVYSAHTKGAPRVPGLGVTGGSAIGPHRTPTTIGHTTKTWSERSST